MNKKLFFVVPVYNVEAYLRRCVMSIIGQTYENTQIVLVDDGSTDTSGKICDEFAYKYNNIYVIHKENGGLSSARNAGIEYCIENSSDNEDYITFIDSDDFIMPQYGEYLIRLSRIYSADVVQCRYEKGSGDEFSVQKKLINEFYRDNTDALLGYDLKSQTTPKLYKLKLFDDIRFPVGVLNEDEYTTYRLAYKSENVAFTDKKLYYYYQHSGSIMDTIAKRLKNNPHRNDWLMAYVERYLFFEAHNEKQLMLRTLEKICTDIILRYSEQMALKKDDRDAAARNGEYIRAYRYFYSLMIRRPYIPMKRRFIYAMFYMCPVSGYIAGKITNLRK